MTEPSSNSTKPPVRRWIAVARIAIEIGLIVVLFGLVSGQLPPDVNESHYLTKAKHGWDPTWCAGDLFLESSFSHWLFYASTGWLHSFLSLTQVAWVGRIVTWVFIAFSWQQMASSILPRRGAALISAAMFLLLNERFHLAGEWVVGGFEAKGLAYGFVLLALAMLVRQRLGWCGLFLGCATAFHVLVGGWSWLALFFGIGAYRFLCRGNLVSNWKGMAPGWTLGVLISLIGVIPPLLAESSSNPEHASVANWVYVNQRIAHHLDFSAFRSIHIARFLLMTLGLFVLSSQLRSPTSRSESAWRKLFCFSIGSLMISFCGLWLSGLAEADSASASWYAGLLRFYWFRLADFAIPCVLALGCSISLDRLLFSSDTSIGRLEPICGGIFLIAIVVAFAGLVVENNWDPRPPADRVALPSFDDNWDRTEGTYKNWRKVCAWIADNTPTDSVFITPAAQQTFKWYAGRTEVVCWKDIPQDPDSIVEWQQRVNLLCQPQRRFDTGIMSYDDQQLRELAKRFGATHLLVPQAHLDLLESPTDLKQVYPASPEDRSSYVVFEFQLP